MTPTERLLHEIDEIKEAQKSSTAMEEYISDFDAQYMKEVLQMAYKEIQSLRKEVVKSGVPIARTA
jgi:phage host-nuclease inhibitor protein Gam